MKRKRALKGDRTEQVLLRAETEFIADPHRRSVEHWYNELLHQLISLDYARQYAADNHWIERRQSFWKGVQAAWLKERHVQLVQQRSSELHQAIDLRSKAYELIRPKIDEKGVEQFPIQPRSWEGAVRAFVALDDMVETKREYILTQIEPMIAQSEEQQIEERSELPFTRDEMRKLAHGLLQARRKRRRQEMGIEDEDENGTNDDRNQRNEVRSEGDLVGSRGDKAGVAGKIEPR